MTNDMIFRGQKNKQDKNIIIIGDVTSRYRLMMKLYNRKLSDFHIIVLGNLCYGSSSVLSTDMYDINSYLASNNNKMYVVPGDNDNIPYCDKMNFSNIKFKKDLTSELINGIRFLFVSGSEQYDRYCRFDIKKRKTYYKIYERDVPNQKIDVIVSHETPDFSYPYNLHNIKPLMKNDKWIYNDVKKTRHRLSEIYSYLKRRNHNMLWYCSKHNKDMVENKDKLKIVHVGKMNIVKM